ncbi:MAG TPA: NUDIX domain-containing protein [Candidatus Saccharimonadales bacterium]|nr:NUDIX domain-containing protein [Candidatus Saccharimonadales bacterium]
MTTAKERFKLIPAVYLILRKGDEVLLLQRANTGYQDGKYSLVSGHLDGDELATHGLAREAKEEAGVTVRPQDLVLVHTVHRLSRNQNNQERMDLFFETTQWEGKITNIEPDKCSDLRWFDINHLPDATIPLVRQVLEAVARGGHYSEYIKEPV